jgi:DNA-binding NtrC family response regulator
MCAAHMLCRWRTQWNASGRPGRVTVRATVPTLRVPSLRERLQDLPEIALRALKKQAERDAAPMRRLSPAALDELRWREWRGNIDELAAVLERAAQRAGGRPVIEATDLPRSTEPRWRPSQYAKDEGQRDCLLRQLRTARTVSAAARLEGCTRANYIRLMRRLGILRGDIVEQRPDLDRDAVADRVLA